MPYPCTYIKNALCMSLPSYVVTFLAPHSLHAWLHFPWGKCAWSPTKCSCSQLVRVWNRLWFINHYRKCVGGTSMIHTWHHPSTTSMWIFSSNGLLVIFPTSTLAHLFRCSTRYISCSNSNVYKGSHFLAFENQSTKLYVDSLHSSYPHSQYFWVLAANILQF